MGCFWEWEMEKEDSTGNKQQISPLGWNWRERGETAPPGPVLTIGLYLGFRRRADSSLELVTGRILDPGQRVPWLPHLPTPSPLSL